jgi:diamine N-acetyltransferase
MIEYRPPQPKEVEALATLSRDTFREAFAHLYSAEDLALFEAAVYASEVIAAELASPNRSYLVAYDGEQMIGYCKIGFDKTLDYDGVAQHLTDWAVAEARTVNADALLLSVYSDNPRGQRFYQKNGFAYVADTYFMVGNHRDDEFLYLKPLAA